MRRVLVLVLVGILVGAVAGSAEAGKKKRKTTREAEGRYEASLGTNPGVSPFWVGSPIGNITAVDFPTGAGERYISVRIDDDNSNLTAGTIGADLDGTPQTLETIANFCDETEKPVEIPATSPMRIVTKSRDCDGQPGLATSGTITVTFSNLP